jgi:tetratricopeptide (TPR) repeat protein
MAIAATIHPSLEPALVRLDAGALCEEAGSVKDAARHYRAAIRYLTPLVGAGHPYIAEIWTRLASLYHANGEQVRPERLYRKALDLLRQESGEYSPYAALTLNNLALFCKQNGRLREAGDLYERALYCYERASESGEAIATVLENLAGLWRARALELEQRAARIRYSLALPDRPELRSVDAARACFRLEIRRSNVEGFGVFAAGPIPSGARVIEYTGEKLSRQKAVERAHRERTYLLRLDSYWSLDGSVGGSGAEYINHSCEPEPKI